MVQLEVYNGEKRTRKGQRTVKGGVSLLAAIIAMLLCPLLFRWMIENRIGTENFIGDLHVLTDESRMLAVVALYLTVYVPLLGICLIFPHFSWCLFVWNVRLLILVPLPFTFISFWVLSELGVRWNAVLRGVPGPVWFKTCLVPSVLYLSVVAIKTTILLRRGWRIVEHSDTDKPRTAL